MIKGHHPDFVTQPVSSGESINVCLGTLFRQFKMEPQEVLAIADLH